jgi:exodeoxyribonuclease VII large subunit
MARQTGDPPDLFAYAASKQAGALETPAAEPERAVPGSRAAPLSVTQLVKKASLAVEEGVGKVWLQAEVASLTAAASGHLYMVLKDDKSSVRAVMWKTDASRLRFRMEEGLELSCRGHASIYERDGKFQFYVKTAEPAGAGADAIALQQLTRKLSAEGLFDADRKRPLPSLPRRIGLVTSRHGAAVRDIIRAVNRRFPVPLLLAPAAVQGSGSPAEIAAALDKLGRTDVDVIIVGRGGGSTSDLAAFNSELVVRAIARARVPVISAVGHEIDSSLSDLAADCRAATPTMAGEMAVPVREELRETLVIAERRLARELSVGLAVARQELDRHSQQAGGMVRQLIAESRAALAENRAALERQHPRARMVASRGHVHELEARNRAAMRDLLLRFRERVSDPERILATRMRGSLATAGRDLAAASAGLDAMSPLSVLDRGYAIATAVGGDVIRRAEESLIGTSASVRLAKGTLACRIEGVENGDE